MALIGEATFLTYLYFKRRREARAKEAEAGEEDTKVEEEPDPAQQHNLQVRIQFYGF